MALKRTFGFLCLAAFKALTSEAVECAALPLESVHDVHGGHSLPLGVLGVGDGITDDVLQEDLEHPTGLLVDQAEDTLDYFKNFPELLTVNTIMDLPAHLDDVILDSSKTSDSPSELLLIE